MVDQLKQELAERDQSLEELGVHASRVAKRGVVTEGLMEKYATMCGVSEDELKSILVERGCEDTEEAEVLDESNYMFDARFRGVVHHLGDQPGAQAAPKMGTRAVVMQDVPTQYGARSAVSGVDSSDATLFSMQRKLKKLSFENRLTISFRIALHELHKCLYFFIILNRI